MSKVKIQGHSSGSGTITITGPNTNSDRTLTIPDITGTAITSGDTGTVTQAIVHPDAVNKFISGRKNLIINGKFQINQRGAVSKTTTTSAYNYDRWYFDGTNLRYKVEAGDFLPSTTYTISGTNVTTAQITSPASGVWTFTVPATADLVQLELGSVATDFEHRSYGEELALCQRYYLDCGRWFVQGYGYAGSNDGVGSALMFPTTMRDAPTLTKTGEDHGGSYSTMVFNFIGRQGVSVEAQSTNNTQNDWVYAYVAADAEL